MEKIKIDFLGTGDAIPTKARNHTSILIGFANENILIDCGEGTQRQLKTAGLNMIKITKILITHWHGDHILGLPGLLQTLAMSNYSNTLEIYGPKGTRNNLEIIKKLIKNFNIKLKIQEVSGTFINNQIYSIEAQAMYHGTPANAYSIKLKDKIRLNKKKIKSLKLPNSPLLKKLQEGKDIIINGKKVKSNSVTYKEKGKKITFIMDTKFNNNAIKLAEDSDLLIAESTFSSLDEKKAHEYLHLTAKEAASIAKKSNSKKLILTHISQRYEKNLSIIEKEAKTIFKNCSIAKDFDSIII